MRTLDSQIQKNAGRLSAMKRLAATICLTFALLLGSWGNDYAVSRASSAEPSYLEASRYLHVIPNKIDKDTLSYRVEGEFDFFRVHMGMVRTYDRITTDSPAKELYRKIFPLEDGKEIKFSVSDSNQWWDIELKI